MHCISHAHGNNEHCAHICPTWIDKISSILCLIFLYVWIWKLSVTACKRVRVRMCVPARSSRFDTFEQQQKRTVNSGVCLLYGLIKLTELLTKMEKTKKNMKMKWIFRRLCVCNIFLFFGSFLFHFLFSVKLSLYFWLLHFFYRICWLLISTTA